MTTTNTPPLLPTLASSLTQPGIIHNDKTSPPSESILETEHGIIPNVCDDITLEVPQMPAPPIQTPPPLFKKGVERLGYLGILGGVSTAAYQALQAGTPEASVIIGSSVVATALVYLTEQLIPYKQSWQVALGDLKLDALHNFVATSIFPQTVQWSLKKLSQLAFPLTTLGLISAAHYIGFDPQLFTTPLWDQLSSLQELHPALQLGLILAVGEFGTYIAHRAVHEIPELWELHAVHHSPDKLNVTKAGVNNFIDALKYMLGHWLPLKIAGVPDELIAMGLVFTTTNGFLQHSNSNFKLGALEYIISGVQAHRWHHDAGAHKNSNYGINLMIFDTLSSWPEWGLTQLTKIFPKLNHDQRFNRVLKIAEYLNSLHLPKNETPEAVGIEHEITDPHKSTLQQFADYCFVPIKRAKNILAKRLKNISSTIKSFISPRRTQ